MSFTYPLGLLGLIGIPVVIIIYILRSKYNEQTVSSTYLWKLSDKFLKRRNPLSGLTGIISLVLQILTVTVISVAIAQPIFVLPGAANDYCFVLDTTGSMNMNDGRETRLERAKDEITKIIRSSADGSAFSLTCVADETVVMFESVTSKDTAVELVEQIRPEYTSADSTKAVKAAQKYFDANTSAFVYLVTDKSYETKENIEIIRVGEAGEDNFALTDLTYSQAAGKLSVSAKVISYSSDKELTVKLYLDGADTASAEVKAVASAGTPSDVALECSCISFSSFRVEIDDSDVYAADNGLTTYNLKSEKTYSTLIVSKSGFFFKSVIDALTDSEITVISPLEYPSHTEKYGLYIFDSYTPSELPDGAVWLINSDRSIEKSGFGIKGKVGMDSSAAIKKSSSSASAVKKLLEDVTGDSIYVKNYIKYSGMYLNFHTLFSHNSNPLIFAGTNGLGHRQVVFGFDIHQSDLALSPDFPIIMRNLLEYSFPDVLEKSSFTVGEEAVVNLTASTESVKAFAPSGKEVYANTDGATATFKLEEVGTYTVNVKTADAEMNYKIYSCAHPDESAPTVEEERFALYGERTYDTRDGEFDPQVILFVCLALLFIADWGVFCYEKYQLR